MSNACDNITDNFAAWGIDKPHVVGNSLGGAIALELGARGMVSSVTALSPAGFFGPVNKLQTSKTSWGRRLAGITLYSNPERFTADEVYGDAIALKRCTGFERSILAGVGYKFVRPVAVPTTIAWGTRDLILPYSYVALPHCGHIPMVDDPELVARVIDNTIETAVSSEQDQAA